MCERIGLFQLHNCKQFTTKISAIMDTKRRSAIVQDGQKKKITISKDNFSALHVSL